MNGIPREVDRTLDTLGYYCPIPVIRTGRALETMRAGEVLEHVPDCRVVVAETVRVLKRGGFLYLRGPITTNSLARRLALWGYAVAGREIVANVVGLGVLAGLTKIVSRKSLEAAVRERAPRGTEEINLKALAAGFDAAKEALKARRKAK